MPEQMNYPLVSCIMPTYNMPARLSAVNEAVESFLRQDYPNKELIIIIDSAGQTLVYDHPQVIVINSTERYQTLGDKLNAAISRASGEFVCRWDDDDISLPWRISSQVNDLLGAQDDYVTPASVWIMDNGRLEWRMQPASGHSQGMMRMSTFRLAGGYAPVSGCEDVDLHRRLQAVTPRRVIAMYIPCSTPFIYRWNDGLPHLSSFDNMQYAYSMNATEGTPGEYRIAPHWRRAYTCLTRILSDATKPVDIPPPMEHVKLCVVGYPSKCGGAETELDHQITLWRALGVGVHLIPTREPDESQLSLRVAERGCTVHAVMDWSACQGMHVISYCSAAYLKNLREIKRYARSTTWVNCMTWLSQEECDAHAQDLIDWFLYQTEHARLKMASRLRDVNRAYQWALVRPFFDASLFPFNPARSAAGFTFCRISRGAPDKFRVDTMDVFRLIQADNKRGIVLGYSDTVSKKIGPPPEGVECLAPGARPVVDVLSESHCLIQSGDVLENLPRVGMEAMASGTVVLADDTEGWQELLGKDGACGMLCREQFDFVCRATYLAQHPEIRHAMAVAARQRVLDLFGFAATAPEWVSFLNTLEACHPCQET